MPKILVLYATIGSGHQVAAEAIAAALQTGDVEAICRDPLAEHSPALIRWLNLGNSLSGLAIPQLYNRLWSNGRASPLTNWITTHSAAAHPIRSVIDAIKPDRIVCTHALPARVAAEHTSPAPVVGVITDYGAHAYWPHPAIDEYCVPCDEAATDLIKFGVDPNRIHITGLPIQSHVAASRAARDEVISAMTGRLNVLIVMGGRRSGPYRHTADLIIDALPRLDRLDRPIAITIVTGANRSAYEHLNALKLHRPIELLGVVDDLPARMSSADIVIGKPGGVMTAEVLAAGAAFIAVAPGPGQETANAKFLKRHDLAIICHRNEELIDAIMQLAANTILRSEMRRAALRFSRPNAADEVAQVVLKNESHGAGAENHLRMT